MVIVLLFVNMILLFFVGVYNLNFYIVVECLYRLFIVYEFRFVTVVFGVVLGKFL